MAKAKPTINRQPIRAAIKEPIFMGTSISTSRDVTTGAFHWPQGGSVQSKLCTGCRRNGQRPVLGVTLSLGESWTACFPTGTHGRSRRPRLFGAPDHAIIGVAASNPVRL